MVLSKQEFDAAESGDTNIELNKKMSSLFQLRQSTRSFLIQCLADRELQTLIYSQPNYSSPKSAYNYNCSVVHNPHAWSHVRTAFLLFWKTSVNYFKFHWLLQLNAIIGHGWNIKRHQPFDPQLRVAHVLANQYSNNKQNIDDNLVIRNQQAREQIRQFEETIRILKEENTQVKQLYLNAFKNERLQNVNHNNNASNSQQIIQLQQEIRTLKSVIDSHKATIQILEDRNYALQFTVNDMQIPNANVSNNQLIHNLQKELQTMKSNLESKIENIRILESQNNNLRVRLREAEINSSSNGRFTSRREDNVSQGCCTIM